MWRRSAVTKELLPLSQDAQCAQALTALANLVSPISCLVVIGDFITGARKDNNILVAKCCSQFASFDSFGRMHNMHNMHDNAIAGNNFIESAPFCADGIEVRVVTWPGLRRCCAVSIVFFMFYHCILSDTKVASDPFSNSPRHLFFITPPFIVLHFIRNLNWVSWNQEQAIWTGLNSCATVAAMSCRSVSPRTSAAKHHKATYEILWEFMKHLFPFQPCRFAMGSKTSLKLLPNLKEGVILFVEVPLSLCRCRTSRSLCSELGDVPTLCSKDSGEKNAHVLGWGQCYKHTHTQTPWSLIDYIDYTYISSKEVLKSKFRQYWQMKSRDGKSQRREEKKREDQRRERVRRKKIQVREKVQ